MRIFVFTFKAGALSAMGHDLELEAANVSVSSGRVVVDASSLRVLRATKGGEISASDRATIEKNARDVLDVFRYPTITFTVQRADAATGEIEGELELHGTKRRLALRATRANGAWSAEVELDQTDFGIKPYSAFLGALKIKPRVIVRAELEEGSDQLPLIQARS